MTKVGGFVIGRPRAFTLLELIIVIALIALVAAIAIPNIVAARKAGNEGAAIGALKSIVEAQSLFREGDKENDGLYDYGTLSELSNANVIDGILGAGTKNGYTFTTDASGLTRDYIFWAFANPAVMRSTGDRAFATNHSAVIYYTSFVPVATGPSSQIDTDTGKIVGMEPIK